MSNSLFGLSAFLLDFKVDSCKLLICLTFSAINARFDSLLDIRFRIRDTSCSFDSLSKHSFILTELPHDESRMNLRSRSLTRKQIQFVVNALSEGAKNRNDPTRVVLNKSVPPVLIWLHEIWLKNSSIFAMHQKQIAVWMSAQLQALI